jgi:4'-phosphopantetheinyl transferase EntD
MLYRLQYPAPSLPFYSASYNKPCTPDVLHPDEHRLLNGASAKRIGEFCAGRYCAHQVLEQLGYKDVSVLKNLHGAPLWPAGIVGSISHSREMSIAVAARSVNVQAIGVDIQYCEPPFPRQSFTTLLRPQEIRTILDAPAELADQYAYSIFAAKESALKCVYGASGHWLEFTDILIDLNLADGWFLLSIPSKRAFSLPGWLGRVYFDGAYVVTVTWLK